MFDLFICMFLYEIARIKRIAPLSSFRFLKVSFENEKIYLMNKMKEVTQEEDNLSNNLMK